MSPTLLVVQHVDHEDAALVGELARQEKAETVSAIPLLISPKHEA